MSLNPFHSDRSLCCGPALAGIIVVLLAALELFALAPAIAPRSLSFVDEAGAPLVVEVRVGTAVDTVAQAGRPKSITGFQTLSSPVLLGVKDRAELVDDTYIAAAAVLEGVVVLRPNPAAKAKKETREREAKEKKLRLAMGGGARSDLTWQ